MLFVLYCKLAQGQSVPGGTVTAVPWKGGFALFLSDPNAGVYTATGIPGAPQTWGPWRLVSYGNSKPGATITPVQYNDQIALFSIDQRERDAGKPDDWAIGRIQRDRGRMLGLLVWC